METETKATHTPGVVSRYEVRGSNLYDNTEQRPISIFEAGDTLNAHEALLLKEGVWAAKAGLADGKADQWRDVVQDLLEALEVWLHTTNEPASVNAAVAKTHAAIAKATGVQS